MVKMANMPMTMRSSMRVKAFWENFVLLKKDISNYLFLKTMP